MDNQRGINQQNLSRSGMIFDLLALGKSEEEILEHLEREGLVRDDNRQEILDKIRKFELAKLYMPKSGSKIFVRVLGLLIAILAGWLTYVMFPESWSEFQNEPRPLRTVMAVLGSCAATVWGIVLLIKPGQVDGF